MEKRHLLAGGEDKRHEVEKQENYSVIQQLNKVIEHLKAENRQLQSDLELELADKIRLISQEENFIRQLDQLLENSKKVEQENKALIAQVNFLENQAHTIMTRYHALSSSKLGRLTLKYWTFRKRWVRGS